MDNFTHIVQFLNHICPNVATHLKEFIQTLILLLVILQSV